MSLAVADKLLRAFEALKNFKDGTATSDPNVAATAKLVILHLYSFTFVVFDPVVYHIIL